VRWRGKGRLEYCVGHSTYSFSEACVFWFSCECRMCALTSKYQVPAEMIRNSLILVVGSNDA
jgi:hypothetical protein